MVPPACVPPPPRVPTWVAASLCALATSIYPLIEAPLGIAAAAGRVEDATQPHTPGQKALSIAMPDRNEGGTNAILKGADRFVNWEASRFTDAGGFVPE